MKCKRCGEYLSPEDFRPLRKQRHGVCKACEYREKYEAELRARERRRAQRETRDEECLAWAREIRMRILPDD